LHNWPDYRGFLPGCREIVDKDVQENKKSGGSCLEIRRSGKGARRAGLAA
jgi:hypothetical protein